jgi:hypothetical protein
LAPLDVLRRIIGLAPRPAEERYSFDDYLGWINSFGFAGNQYGLTGLNQTLTGDWVEPATPDFLGLAQQAFGTSPVVFACMAVRQYVFSAARFQWQQMLDGRPSRLFGTQALSLLETPWVGGTTQDLLARMIQDADIAGSCYQIIDTPLPRIGGDGGREIVRLRPDWVEVIMEPRLVRGSQVGWRRIGYVYTEGGASSGGERTTFQPWEMSQFSPMPDPLARWRGMSWLTPVIREIEADKLMTGHRRKFFENGATPNMIVKYPEGVSAERIREYRRLFDAEHKGVDNAYKRLHIGGGADATVVGANMQQMTFKEVQGAGETRIAAAAGTPPVIVGLSEGLQGSSLNQGNYAMARRRFADGTMHPLWQNVSGSLAPLLGTVPGASGASVRLWYDTRDVPFLREDEKDAAEIQFTRSKTLRAHVDSGWTPESALAAMLSDDEGLLRHSGLYSVQLQAAGGQPAGTPGAPPSPPGPVDAPPAEGTPTP